MNVASCTRAICIRRFESNSHIRLYCNARCPFTLPVSMGVLSGWQKKVPCMACSDIIWPDVGESSGEYLHLHPTKRSGELASQPRGRSTTFPVCR